MFDREREYVNALGPVGRPASAGVRVGGYGGLGGLAGWLASVGWGGG